MVKVFLINGALVPFLAIRSKFGVAALLVQSQRNPSIDTKRTLYREPADKQHACYDKCAQENLHSLRSVSKHYPHKVQTPSQEKQFSGVNDTLMQELDKS